MREVKFKFTKEVDGLVNSYFGRQVKTDQILSFDSEFAEKVKKNPNYECLDNETVIEEAEIIEVVEEPKPKKAEKAKAEGLTI